MQPGVACSAEAADENQGLIRKWTQLSSRDSTQSEAGRAPLVERCKALAVRSLGRPGRAGERTEEVGDF